MGRAEIEQMGAILLKGDALDKEDVEKVFNSVDDIDAVISTIGGTPANPLVDSQVIYWVVAPALIPYLFQSLVVGMNVS